MTDDVLHLPERWPVVPDDFTGPCLIEVTPSERAGRGRYWQANQGGYTDDLLRAGVYPASLARQIVRRSDRATLVDAGEALRQSEGRLAAFREALDQLGPRDVGVAYAPALDDARAALAEHDAPPCHAKMADDDENYRCNRPDGHNGGHTLYRSQPDWIALLRAVVAHATRLAEDVAGVHALSNHPGATAAETVRKLLDEAAAMLDGEIEDHHKTGDLRDELEATLLNERGEGSPPGDGWTWRSIPGSDWSKMLSAHDDCVFVNHETDREGDSRWTWAFDRHPEAGAELTARAAMIAADAAHAKRGVGVRGGRGPRAGRRAAQEAEPFETIPVAEMLYDDTDRRRAHERAETPPLAFTYRNHRDEVAERRVLPARVWFGASNHHPEPTWLLRAYDLDRRAERDFAIERIVGLDARAAMVQITQECVASRAAGLVVRQIALCRPDEDLVRCVSRLREERDRGWREAAQRDTELLDLWAATQADEEVAARVADVLGAAREVVAEMGPGPTWPTAQIDLRDEMVKLDAACAAAKAVTP